jgi:NAD(P)-dependent dehydrogenase (short-subunit alcohol dehydrogenase family)
MKTHNTQKAWFITGTSKGFGLSLVQQLLAKGERVAATSRNKKDIENLIPKNENFLALEMDLTDEYDVKRALDQTLEAFGRIDVIVNNAGYGLIGALEELSDKESRQNFDVNVFGSLNVIRQALPQLRKQRFGHIINISSIGGYSGDFPGFGIYCATKFAVVGFTESLAMEVAPFNIRTTVVLPGYFRTNFLNSDSLSVPQNQIADYGSIRESQQIHQKQINGNQPGDPEKGVAAIIAIVSEENPPLHLFLGSDAYTMASNKAKTMMEEVESRKSISVGTDF